MHALRKGCVALLLAAGLAPAADPGLMNLVMPDARMISGFNIEQAKASPFGQFLLSQVQSTEPGLEKFILATGFDPRRDLHEMLIASAAAPVNNRGLVLVRGLFDAGKIAGIARQHGAVVEKYKGVEMLSGKRKEVRPSSEPNRQAAQAWFAFLDNSIAVMGDLASVRGAIDRMGGGTGPDPVLAAKAHELSNRYDFWGISVIPVSDWAGKVPDDKVSGAMKGDVLQAVLETRGGLKFGSDIEITGEAVTRSEKDATALADVIRFLTGLVQLNQKDARITGPASLLQSLNLTTEGNVMKLSLRIPEADLEKAIASAKAQQGHARRRAATAAQAPPNNTGNVIIHSSPKEMGTVVITPQN